MHVLVGQSKPTSYYNLDATYWTLGSFREVKTDGLKLKMYRYSDGKDTDFSTI